MSTFNWSDLQKAADDAGFTPVPDGPYDLEIAKATAKKTSGGKDQIEVQFKILSGPNEGRLVFNNFVISPESANALGFFFRDMAALGLTREYFASNPKVEAVATALQGRRCHAEIGHREWGGTTRNDVKKITPPTGGVQAPPTPGVLGGAIPGATIPGAANFPGVPTVTTSAVVPPSPVNVPVAVNQPVPVVDPVPPAVPGGLGTDDEPPF